jgi:hypothetical protein
MAQVPAEHAIRHRSPLPRPHTAQSRLTDLLINPGIELCGEAPAGDTAVRPARPKGRRRCRPLGLHPLRTPVLGAPCADVGAGALGTRARSRSSQALLAEDRQPRPRSPSRTRRTGSQRPGGFYGNSAAARTVLPRTWPRPSTSYTTARPPQHERLSGPHRIVPSGGAAVGTTATWPH